MEQPNRMDASAMNASNKRGRRGQLLGGGKTPKKKILFVCTYAKARSATAEEMFNGVGGIEAKSAGTAKDYPNCVTKELMDWAEVILVMEEIHRQYLIEVDGSSAHKILVLDIPDLFGRNQPELIQLLHEKAQPILKY